MIPLRLVRMESNARTIAIVLSSSILAWFIARFHPVTPIVAPLFLQLALEPNNRGRRWTGHLPVSAHTQWLSRMAVTIPAIATVTLAAVLGARDFATAVLLGSTGFSVVLFLLLLIRCSDSRRAHAPFGLLASFAVAAIGWNTASFDLETAASRCPSWLFWSIGGSIMALWWIDRRQPAVFEEQQQFREPPPTSSGDMVFFAIYTLAAAFTLLSVAVTCWTASFGAQIVFATSKLAHLPVSPRRAFARRALPVVAIMAAASGLILVVPFSVTGWLLEFPFFKAARVGVDGDARHRLYPLPLYLNLDRMGPYTAALDLHETASFLAIHRGYRGAPEDLRKVITEELQFGVRPHRYFDMTKFKSLYPDLWRGFLIKLTLKMFFTLMALWSLRCIHQARGSRPQHWWLFLGVLVLGGSTAYLRVTGWTNLIITLVLPSDLSVHGWDLGPTAALAIAASATAYLIAQEAFVRSSR